MAKNLIQKSQSLNESVYFCLFVVTIHGISVLTDSMQVLQ